MEPCGSASAPGGESHASWLKESLPETCSSSRCGRPDRPQGGALEESAPSARSGSNRPDLPLAGAESRLSPEWLNASERFDLEGGDLTGGSAQRENRTSGQSGRTAAGRRPVTRMRHRAQVQRLAPGVRISMMARSRCSTQEAGYTTAADPFCRGATHSFGLTDGRSPYTPSLGSGPTGRGFARRVAIVGRLGRLTRNEGHELLRRELLRFLVDLITNRANHLNRSDVGLAHRWLPRVGSEWPTACSLAPGSRH
jgi:hypothetical protein